MNLAELLKIGIRHTNSTYRYQLPEQRKKIDWQKVMVVLIYSGMAVGVVLLAVYYAYAGIDYTLAIGTGGLK